MTAPRPAIPAAPMNAVASSSSPPPPTPADALLAPGFRFHPTDEELVIYYLKRRVSGRPLRFDAIAEVDLYKTEPWDLPTMSRLRSRDMEWYFFSPLDRKYSNRSRTNRATAQGYWKTTGKDRPVRHGPRAVGMKKTLVFHVGRAPHGKRTNWVMHEYRLEDEELTRTGVSQDGYVVCRIFQKNGSGPQNGAQYGAPFVEEEWDGADELVLAIEGGGNVATGAEYLQLDDFENNQDEGNQHECHPEDSFLPEEKFQDEIFDDGMNAPLLQDTLYNSTGGNSGPAVTSHSPPSQGGFMELNDLGSAVNVDYPSSEDSVDCFLGKCNVQMPINGGDGSNNLPKVYEVEEFFNEDTDSRAPFQMCPTVEYDSHLEPNDLLNPMAGDYPPDQMAEGNMLFYDGNDAPSFNLPFDQDKFVQMDDLQFSPMADSSGFNLVDDIMAYFDSTDNLHYSTLDSSEKLQLVDSSAWNQSNFSPEVDGSVDPTYKATPSEVNVGVCASSSVILPKADNQSNSINENVTVQLDSDRKKGYIKKFTGGLQNMLGAISAPPAHASQPPVAACKSLGPASTANVASSIHVTTGMIQIHGFKVMGSAEHWSLRRSGDVGFRLTCGMARDGVVPGPDGLEPVAKLRGWTMSVVLRGGFYLFFLLAMFLAVGFKVGMRVCSR